MPAQPVDRIDRDRPTPQDVALQSGVAMSLRFGSFLSDRRLGLTSLLAMCGLAVAAVATAPRDASAQSGAVSFSVAQADSGETTYAANCAGCHGPALAGTSFAPALTGADFKAKWFGKPLSELFSFVSTEMPQDRPGAFDAPTYAGLVAFLLKSNGVAAGSSDLPTDAAAQAAMALPPA